MMGILDQENKRRWYLYATIGFVQGILFYVLTEFFDAWGKGGLMAHAVLIFVSMAPILFYLTFSEQNWRKAALFSTGLSLFTALLYLWVDVRIGWLPDGFNPVIFPFLSSAAIMVYIALPFFQARQNPEHGTTLYQRLHKHAWNNILYIGLGWAFVGAFWLVLVLWMVLFGLIGIDFFKDLFGMAWFAIPVTATAHGLAIALSMEFGKIVNALRSLAFALLRVLAPVLASALLLFLIFLPFTGLAPLWETASATVILVLAISGSVLLANTVIQDGPGAPDYPKWPLRFLALELAILPIFAGIAIYALYLRIDQYGLTPERVYASVIVAISAMHSLAYSFAILVHRNKWGEKVRGYNIRLAGIMVAMAVLIQTPLIDPYGLSAGNQVDRLRSGQVGVREFDYGYLKFKLGKPGQEALEEIRNADSLPDRDIIDERLSFLDKTDSYWDWQSDLSIIQTEKRVREMGNLEDLFLIRPEGMTIPEDFLGHLGRPNEWPSSSCFNDETTKCAIILADLIPGDRLEIVVVVNFVATIQFAGYRYSDEKWQQFNSIEGRYYGSEKVESLWQALKDGNVDEVTPPYKVLRLGDEIILLAPGRP